MFTVAPGDVKLIPDIRSTFHIDETDPTAGYLLSVGVI